MFCHQCGKELRENAHFCFNCGAPARETAGQTDPAGKADIDAAAAKEPDLLSPLPDTEKEPQADDPGADTKEPDSQTAKSSTDTGEPEAAPKTQDPRTTVSVPDNTQAPVPQENQGTQDPVLQDTPDTQEPALQEIPVPDSAADIETPAGLTLKKGSVTVTGNELHLNRKHYIRKTGKKKFRKEKKPALIPLGSILGTSVEHHKYGGRLFLSLLLLLCFAAGTFFSARYDHDTYNALNTPYREEELAAQESIMTVINGKGAEQLLQNQNSQEENHSAAEALTDKLEKLKIQQTQEILDSIHKSDKFDLDAFFNREFFSRAYQDYLQDLLNAFKADESLHSWLYSYYETSKTYGGNYFLDTDMWIYNSDGENEFSSGLDSAAGLMKAQYDLDLYEHILYTGRIYITGTDFMRVVLSLPRYTVEGAVFTKAYGGTPDAAEMSVPGWTRSHYDEFWLYGVDYYSVDAPMWLDYGLSAENFGLDWNALLDEAAYHDAYKNFMDKIAPGLPRYETASFHADDGAYGGMGCSLKGTEASFSDIIASYAENHPEFIDELISSDNYSKTLTTSVDDEIAETKAQLENLEKDLLDLQEQEKELAQTLADADIHRSNYSLLLADREEHMQELTCRLLFFSGAAFLCLLGILICLCKFFGFMKRPRHLFLISIQDMEYAFNTKRYPKEQIAALQSRLSAGVPVSLNEAPAADENSGEAPGET